MRYIILLLVISCSSSKNSSLDGSTYFSDEVQKYLLSELPSWAQFSSMGRCRHTVSTKYLDLPSLYSSLNLDYEQSLQMQSMYNKEINLYLKNTGRSAVFLKDRSFIFNNIQEKIIGGAKDFYPPSYSKINIFWIDLYLKTKSKKLQIKKILEQRIISSGHPVLVSSCLSSLELESLIKEYNLSEYGVRYISKEMFSPYDSKFTKTFSTVLDLNEIFKEKSLKFYGPEFPSEFINLKDSQKVLIK